MLWGGGLDLWICISIIFISVLPAAHTKPVEDWPEDSQLAFPEEGQLNILWLSFLNKISVFVYMLRCGIDSLPLTPIF